MANSLVGGAYEDLSSDAQALVDAFLGDTVGGQVTTEQVEGGGTLIVGTGANGEAQGVLIGSEGSVITGEVNLGGMELTVALPAGIGMAFQGPSEPMSSEQAQEYLNGLVDGVFPSDSSDPGVQAARENLQNSINSVIEALGGFGSGPVVIKFVALTDSSNTGSRAGNEIVFSGNGAGNELLTFALAQLGSDKILTLQNVKAALLVGQGSVKIGGDTAGILTGDAANQNMTGGGGNDTLVGGGGNDTLTGGAGSDVFGFSGAGHMTVTDFDVTRDMLAIKIPGVTNAEGLSQLYTGIEINGSTAVLHFGSQASVTLLSVNPGDLTVDLIKFSL